jgi:hypothetical protein
LNSKPDPNSAMYLLNPHRKSNTTSSKTHKSRRVSTSIRSSQKKNCKSSKSLTSIRKHKERSPPPTRETYITGISMTHLKSLPGRNSTIITRIPIQARASNPSKAQIMFSNKKVQN